MDCCTIFATLRSPGKTILKAMKILIGRTDVADFPDLGLEKIAVKVDTGAYTSAFHASDIEEITEDGEQVVQFRLLDPSHPDYDRKLFRFKHYSKKTIRNSFGQSEERFVIETTIRIFGIDYPIALSLSERSDLKFPVLLGRKFLNKRFIIDTTIKDASMKGRN